MNCEYCGLKLRKEREDCPAYGKKCVKCRQKNHFARVHVCKQGLGFSKQQKKSYPNRKPYKKKSVHDVSDYTSESDCEYVLTVQEVHSVNKKKKITAQIIVNGQTVQFQLDCGSSVNILPETLYMQLCKDHEDLTETNMTLVMYNRSYNQDFGKEKIDSS